MGEGRTADGRRDGTKFRFLVTFEIKSGKNLRNFNPNFKNSRHGFENIDFSFRVTIIRVFVTNTRLFVFITEKVS